MLWSCLVRAAISDNMFASCLKCLSCYITSSGDCVRSGEKRMTASINKERAKTNQKQFCFSTPPVGWEGILDGYKISVFSWFVDICWVITLVWCNSLGDVTDVELFGKTEDTGWCSHPLTLPQIICCSSNCLEWRKNNWSSSVKITTHVSNINIEMFHKYPVRKTNFTVLVPISLDNSGALTILLAILNNFGFGLFRRSTVSTN